MLEHCVPQGLWADLGKFSPKSHFLATTAPEEWASIGKSRLRPRLKKKKSWGREKLRTLHIHTHISSLLMRFWEGERLHQFKGCTELLALKNDPCKSQASLGTILSKDNMLDWMLRDCTRGRDAKKEKEKVFEGFQLKFPGEMQQNQPGTPWPKLKSFKSPRKGEKFRLEKNKKQKNVPEHPRNCLEGERGQQRHPRSI